MEQRSLRLGDIVDDYCPRERRITNHVVVALIDATIKQTRCTTCDADHPYKDAKVPRRKKTESSAFDQVLADVTGGQPAPPRTEIKPESPAVEAAPPPQPAPRPAPLRPATAPSPVPAVAAQGAQPPAVAPPAPSEPPAHDNEPADGWGWLAQRRLIRATLPRTESDAPPARPIPEFTMHQQPPSRNGRGGGRYGQQPWHGDGGHRGGRGRGHGHSHGEVNGNVDRDFTGNVGPRHARPAPPPVPVSSEPAGNGDRPDPQLGGPGGQPGPGQPPGPGRRGRRRRRHRRPRPPQP